MVGETEPSLTLRNSDIPLPGEGNACVCQFSAQARLICGFQQSTGMSVYLGCQPDHPICERFHRKHNAFSVSTVLFALSPC